MGYRLDLKRYGVCETVTLSNFTSSYGCDEALSWSSQTCLNPDKDAYVREFYDRAI